ncbi:hypothetical protein Syun_016117 [Stephania yunnanensis]|uniref:Uncharacterized protein n=1 Tax=Stephania yunnanensis TaxID=152371 RepID=A0AAP0J606_9MAGN
MAYMKAPTFLILGLLIATFILENNFTEARTSKHVLAAIKTKDKTNHVGIGEHYYKQGYGHGRKLSFLTENRLYRDLSDVASNAWQGTKNLANKAWDGVKSAANATWQFAKKNLNPLNWF